MFERYTEKARLAIFFARYEASTFGSPYIETVHMLLGLLRECKIVRGWLKPDAVEALREKLRSELGNRAVIATSVDLPLGHEAKRMLAFGAEEAELLRHRHIDCGPLFAGLLRMPPSAVHVFLLEQAGDLNQLLQKVRDSLGEYSVEHAPAGRRGHELLENWLSDVILVVPAAEFAPLYRTLFGLLRRSSELMDCYTEPYGETKLRRRPWTRKQALGHIIDWASQYRLWLLRALTEPYLRADSFPPEDAILAQPYSDMRWQFVVESWFSANCLLLIAIAALPGTKAALPCRVGIAEPVALDKLVSVFVERTEDLMEQVLARL
jgi:hypothetical protein